jgi:hypothetical protein
MRMIKMTRNITRFKITSDLQIKPELASNKKRYIRTTTPGLAKVNIYLYLILYMAIFEPYAVMPSLKGLKPGDYRISPRR